MFLRSDLSRLASSLRHSITIILLLSLLAFPIWAISYVDIERLTLGESEGTQVYEDFTTYTETDPNLHISVATSTHVDFDCWRNEDAFLYDDKDANHFGVFSHYIDVQIVETPDQTGDLFGCYLLSNTVEDMNYIRNNDEDFICIWFQYTGSNNRIYFGVGNDAGDTFQYYEDWSENTWYYFTVSRDATNNILKIYSDSDRTTLIDTLTTPLATRDAGSLQYVFACYTYNTGFAFDLEGDVENLDLQEATLYPEIIEISALEPSYILKLYAGEELVNSTTVDSDGIATLTLPIGYRSTTFDGEYRIYNTGGNFTFSKWFEDVGGGDTYIARTKSGGLSLGVIALVIALFAFVVALSSIKGNRR